VLLQVRATALAAGDYHVMAGTPWLVKLMFGLTTLKQPIRGMEVAGRVISLGDDVASELQDTEVIAELEGGGGLGEYAVVKADRVAIRPAEVEPSVAATLAVSGSTAAQAVDQAGLAPGCTALVLGASGGVGTFAVQLAKLAGAEVHATCGAANLQLIKEMGASTVFDYRSTDAGDLTPNTYDAIIDVRSDWPLGLSRRLLRPGGKLIMIGSAGSGHPVLGPIPRGIAGALGSIGSSRKSSLLMQSVDHERLIRLLEQVRTKQLTPLIERTYAFDDARDALARVSSGRVVGKVVVELDQ